MATSAQPRPPQPFHVYVAVLNSGGVEHSIQGSAGAQPPSGTDCPVTSGVRRQSHQQQLLQQQIRYETVLVSPQATAEEIAASFLAAANLSPYFAGEVELNLTAARDGSAVTIGPQMPANTPENRYMLSVNFDALVPKVHMAKLNALLRNGEGNTAKSLTSNLDSLKANIKSLENAIRTMNGVGKVSKRRPAISSHYLSNNKYTLSEETKEFLKQPSFDNWQWEENEMLQLLEHIFNDLGIVEEFQIETPTLRRFLVKIRESYNNNPFHNFRHCFCVSQMMYGIINTTGVVKKLKPIDKLILLTACIGHDADHPGFNNAYQINAQTDLAVIYNDISPLENHHSAVLFTILKSPETNIFKNIPDAVYREVRKGIIRCIMATDMAKHGELMALFKKAGENFNYDDAEHKLLLLQMITKCADISNEVRPMDVAEPWVDCLLQEFFTQSDREKAEGLPTAPFMDRDKVTKASAQVGFIGYVMIPLFELVGKVLPNLEQPVLTPIRQSLAYYKELLEKDSKKA